MQSRERAEATLMKSGEDAALCALCSAPMPADAGQHMHPSSAGPAQTLAGVDRCCRLCRYQVLPAASRAEGQHGMREAAFRGMLPPCMQTALEARRAFEPGEHDVR